MRRALPIGVSDFREIIEGGLYYVDKSLLIKELIDDGSKVLLLPRPRRFGKTLNLSMLRYFYERRDADTSRLFRPLAIWRAGKRYTAHQGQYPVIYLSFKDIKYDRWDDCFTALKGLIAKAYIDHSDALEHDGLKPLERAQYQSIADGSAEKAAYATSLLRLSEYLARSSGRKTILLIDEYDTPIQAGYAGGYYEEIIGFMRVLLSSALKDNEWLEKGVLTGILRVAKESIFSGLNNLRVCSLLAADYRNHFGLLEDEVDDLLAYYGIEANRDEVREWYNGYNFGGAVVYNPWSILNYAQQWRSGPQPYWVNTSANELIEQVLARSGEEVKASLEALVRGGDVHTPIDDQIVFGEIESSPEAVWSFLLMSGYLKTVDVSLADGVFSGRLAIPNREVALVYRRILLRWFRSHQHAGRYDRMVEALLAGEVDAFGDAFAEVVRATWSYFDASGEHPENVYHAFALGLLARLRDQYEVTSNRESGLGRYDVMLAPMDTSRVGILIEFKTARSGESLDEAAEAALTQIAERRYDTALRQRGIRSVVALGIAFRGKEVRVAARRVE